MKFKIPIFLAKKTEGSRELLFCGFIDVRLGARAVYLHGTSSRANFQCLIDDEKSAKIKNDLVVTTTPINHSSDLMTLLNPEVRQEIVQRKAVDNFQPVNSSGKLTAVDINVVAVLGTYVPTKLKIQVFASKIQEYTSKVTRQKSKKLHGLASQIKIHLDLDDQIHSKIIILKILDSYSNWVIATVPVSLMGLKNNENFTCDVKAVENLEFDAMEKINGLRVKFQASGNSFNAFKNAQLTGDLNILI